MIYSTATIGGQDLRGKAPDGPEEQAEQATLDGDKGYKAVLLSTLKRTRELLGNQRNSRMTL
jgi:hypothetical protein